MYAKSPAALAAATAAANDAAAAAAANAAVAEEGESSKSSSSKQKTNDFAAGPNGAPSPTPVSSASVVAALDSCGNTALHVAVLRGHVAVLDALLDDDVDFPLDVRSTTGWTPLQEAVHLGRAHSLFTPPRFKSASTQLIQFNLVCLVEAVHRQ